MLKNMKVGPKLLLCNIGIIVIMTVFMSVSGYYIPKEMLLSNSREQSQELIKQLSDNFNYSIQAMEGNITSVTFTYEFGRLLSNRLSLAPYERKEAITAYGYSVISYQKHIQCVLIEDSEGKIYSSWRKKDILTKEEKEQLLDRDMAYKLKGKTLWKPYSDDLVFATKVIFDRGNMQPVGVMSVGVDVDYFSGMYQGLVDNGNGIVILNKYGDILVATDENYENAARDIQTKYKGKAISGSQIISRDRTYIYTPGETKDGRIQIMNFLPVDSVTKAARAKILPSFLAAALIAILLSVGVTTMISGQISANIKLLLNSIERISKGDFSEKLVPKSYDEIGSLAENFNTMTDQIQVLLHTVSEEKLHKKNSELRALQFEYDSLQAKINPHFLYNTLESINSMAKLEGQDAIAESICMLGNYLRETISSKHRFVTVEEEIQNINQYIAIQKLSYGDKIQAEFKVQEALEEAIVPKLILQPLVENSIVHGIDPKETDGHILVSVYEDGMDMILEVADDGIGIPQEKSEFVMKKQAAGQKDKDKKHTKVGLYAVDKRIRILYGDDYGVTIKSQENCGTTIQIRVPIRFEDEVD